MRIGFFLSGSTEWYAGVVTFTSLIDAIRTTYPDSVRCYLIHNGQVTAVNGHATVNARTGRTGELLVPSEEAGIRDLGLDVIFGKAGFSETSSAEIMVWITDFQHRSAADAYSDQECRDRDHRLRVAAATASRVVVKSQYVAQELKRYLPEHAHKTRVVRFLPCIPHSVYDVDIGQVLARYRLPEKFVYLPSQFWKHKNHALVFAALGRLEALGESVYLVCSGFPRDLRHSRHFDDLMRRCVEWRIVDRMAHVGMIPYEHVLVLMRQSICVLSPSLYEGFANTPSEALSLGKRVLLSDIPAHREHGLVGANFFDPHDPAELAEKLAHLWRNTLPGPDWELEDRARRALPGLRARFAACFISAAREACGSHRSSARTGP